MGTINYILDRDKDEIFELGKGLYFYNLINDIELYLTDEHAFKHVALIDICDCQPKWEIEYCLKLTDRLWEFCKNRIKLYFTSEHFLCDGYLEFNQCKLVESIYVDRDLDKVSKWWNETYIKRKSKTDLKQFEELSEYYKTIT